MKFNDRMRPHETLAEALSEPAHQCNTVNLATITPRSIDWLWPDRIPSGMLTLIGGQPGAGKTTITMSIASIVSRGGNWPFTSDQAAPGDVLILTAEDDLAQTLVPRLMAAGADLQRINALKSVSRVEEDEVIEQSVLLSRDLHQIRGYLAQNTDIRLVIIDPISAYLGVKDSHRDADVRQVLGPLKDLAADFHVAIIGITHLSKANRDSAISRFMGSTGMIAAARAAFLVAEHDDELVMVPVKSNVSASHSGLTYRIVTKMLPGDIQTSAVEWTGETDVTADEALSAQSGDDSPKLREAMDFLRHALAMGPRDAVAVKQEADEQGIALKTLNRAKRQMDIQSQKDRFAGGWKWYTQGQWQKLQERKA